MLNEIDPDYIRLRSLHVSPAMPLWARLQDGGFELQTEDEVAREIADFIQSLHVTPWEQVNNAGRGDVRLVPMSAFTAEMCVTGPVPEWGADSRLPLEQDILFDGEKAFFLAGRQTAFHLIR